jgi:aminoglycoside phosphotransferase (APT) family kinase protein
MSVVSRVAAGLVDALGPDTRVQHRHNHSGTDKLSYAVHAGGRELWVRVAADRDEEHALATWARVGELLAEHHAAPPVVDVLEVAGHTALVFPLLDAVPATRSTLRERYDEADDVLAGLHADAQLAALLGGPTTSAACFRALWLERFVADLDIVEGYLAKDLHAYLADEVEALGLQVDGLEEPVRSAVHGDPWHENWLHGPDRLWLLDWEELTVGDPVVDDAILRHDALGSDHHHWPDEPRYAVARRALMLDAVIDGAADWVENTAPVLRRRKEAAYVAGLEAYRDEFG